jgi:hypothetical protein
LKEVQDRAEEMGWNKSILQIGNPMDLFHLFLNGLFIFFSTVACTLKIFLTTDLIEN